MFKCFSETFLIWISGMVLVHVIGESTGKFRDAFLPYIISWTDMIENLNKSISLKAIYLFLYLFILTFLREIIFINLKKRHQIRYKALSKK